MTTWRRLAVFGAIIGVPACGASEQGTTSDNDVGEAASAVIAAELPVVAPRFLTPPIYGYDDAPRAPDSDDPAIWINSRNRAQSLFIGALKNAGLLFRRLQSEMDESGIHTYPPGPWHAGLEPFPAD